MWGHRTCHPNALLVQNLLPQPLGVLLIDDLQVSAPDRDLLRCRGPLGPRSCLSWGGPQPKADQYCGINAWTPWPESEQLSAILVLEPHGASQDKAFIMAQFLPLSSPASLHSLFQVTSPESLLLIHKMLSALHLRVSFPKDPRCSQHAARHIQNSLLDYLQLQWPVIL